MTEMKKTSRGKAVPEVGKVQAANGSATRIQEAALKARRVEAFLRGRVHGQPEAVAALGKLAFEIALQKKRSRPLVAIFLGPPACGKSMSALLFAEAVQQIVLSDPSAGATEFVDAQRYGNGRSAEDLWGGSIVQSGRLAGTIQEHRNAVVVVDEIEKSSTEFLMGWLQPLGNGWIAKGNKRIDVSGATILFTSNLGHELWAGNGTPLSVDLFDLLSTAKRPSEEKHYWASAALPKELVSRLSQGLAVLFRPLGGHHRFRILLDAIEECGRD